MLSLTLGLNTDHDRNGVLNITNFNELIRSFPTFFKWEKFAPRIMIRDPLIWTLQTKRKVKVKSLGESVQLLVGGERP